MPVGKLVQVRPAGREVEFWANPAEIPRSGGVGGWREVKRPRAQTALEWEGLPPFRTELLLYFEGMVSGRDYSRAIDQEPKLRALESMARPTWVGSGQSRRPEPPLLKLLNVGFQDARFLWVIESLDWISETRNAQQRRIQCEVRVTLLQHSEPEYALSGVDQAKSNVGARAASDSGGSSSGGGGGGGGSYRVKSGDTLSEIAAKQLGDYTKWREIARLNGISSPYIIRPGQTLRMP